MEVSLAQSGKSAHASESTVIKVVMQENDRGVDKPGLAAIQQHGEYHGGEQVALEFRLRPSRS